MWPLSRRAGRAALRAQHKLGNLSVFHGLPPIPSAILTGYDASRASRDTPWRSRKSLPITPSKGTRPPQPPPAHCRQAARRVPPSARCSPSCGGRGGCEVNFPGGEKGGGRAPWSSGRVGAGEQGAGSGRGHGEQTAGAPGLWWRQGEDRAGHRDTRGNAQEISVQVLDPNHIIVGPNRGHTGLRSVGWRSCP